MLYSNQPAQYSKTSKEEFDNDYFQKVSRLINKEISVYEAMGIKQLVEIFDQNNTSKK